MTFSSWICIVCNVVSLSDLILDYLKFVVNFNYIWIWTKLIYVYNFCYLKNKFIIKLCIKPQNQIQKLHIYGLLDSNINFLLLKLFSKTSLHSTQTTLINFSSKIYYVLKIIYKSSILKTKKYKQPKNVFSSSFISILFILCFVSCTILHQLYNYMSNLI